MGKDRGVHQADTFCNLCGSKRRHPSLQVGPENIEPSSFSSTQYWTWNHQTTMLHAIDFGLTEIMEDRTSGDEIFYQQEPLCEMQSQVEFRTLMLEPSPLPETSRSIIHTAMLDCRVELPIYYWKISYAG